MKYQFCIRFKNIDANSAASKAVMDCKNILTSNGYEDFTLTVGDNTKKIKYYPQLFKSIIKFFFAIKWGSVICIQYPLLSINSVFKNFIKIAGIKNIKFYAIIHDLESLRTGGNDREKIQLEIRNLNGYHVIIVHNKHMEDWLLTNGITTKIIILDLFDYLFDNFKLLPPNMASPPKIVFAGNLSKSTFIYSLDKIKNCVYNVYGPGFQKEKVKNNDIIYWKGVYSPEEIPTKIQGDFGLIWDGNSIDKCDEVLGAYLNYNNPHKCSLYIAAGLPLIAPKQSAIGQFIKQHGVGILIESLHELEDLNVSQPQYKEFRENVEKIRDQIQTGYFFNKVIINAEEALK